jgi:hypothetical protein
LHHGLVKMRGIVNVLSPGFSAHSHQRSNASFVITGPPAGL